MAVETPPQSSALRPVPSYWLRQLTLIKSEQLQGSAVPLAMERAPVRASHGNSHARRVGWPKPTWLVQWLCLERLPLGSAIEAIAERGRWSRSAT